MKKLIFDLDGTLWDTGDAYIYSYNTTCEEFQIPVEKRNGPEYVLSYLGVKLDELVMTIIPEAEDKQQLGMLLLKNVVEYLVKHPQTYSSDIYGFFKKLSENYEIYIVSNCPRGFLDGFYAVSGVKEFITGDNTIEISDKTDAIKRITDNYKQRALFIGDAESDYDSIIDHSVVQFAYASYGYGNCSNYSYYLESLESLPVLLESVVQMERILENEKYEVIGHKDSFAALIQKKDCNYFGFLNVKNTEDFDSILKQLKQRTGNRTLVGPVNNSSWFSYRIPLNEFDIKLYPDCNGSKELLDVFLNNGFSLYKKYISTLSEINYDVWKKDKKVKLHSDYECKVVTGEEINLYLEDIYKISVECFSDHDFYEDISLKDFKELYMAGIASFNALLTLVLYKGNVVGFNFCYPDPENRFFILKTFAILKGHRSPKILRRIVEITHEQIEAGGFDKILFHFQQDGSRTTQSYFKDRIVFQKEYGVLKYEPADK